MSAEPQLVTELIRLRRGWALHARDLRARVGPHLIALSGVRAADDNREIRDKVRQLLISTIAHLPPELARAARVAYALEREHQHRQLTLRIESLAGEQSWAPRTARRRMDHAVRLMAQTALRRPTRPGGDSDGAPEPDAHTNVDPTSITAVVRLDAGSPPTPDAGLVVLRVPVPRDRFALLIKFDGVAAS